MRAVVDELKAGVRLVRAGRFHAPPVAARLRRVFYAGAVLVALWQAMWNSPALRRRYLRAVGRQAGLVVVAGLLWALFLDNTSLNIGVEDGDFTVKDGERAATSLWAALLGLFATMAVFEWIVIALTRQHHDALSYDVSTLVGVPPEERIDAPRTTLDLRWLWTKTKRRVHGGVILLACALPPSLLLLIVVGPIAGGLVAYGERFGLNGEVAETVANAPGNLVVFALGGYWLGVFTLGKTAHAWRDAVVGDPIFLRMLEAGAQRRPRLLGWCAWWARMLRRLIGVVARPASVVEHAPWETLGLVAVRVALGVPGVYVLVRPLIPVAATVIIAARSPTTLAGLPVSVVLDERMQ